LIVHERADDFETGACVDCHVSDSEPSGLVLNTGASYGTYTSAPIPLEQPALQLVVSINLFRGTRGSSGAGALVQAEIDGRWTPWYQMVTWGLADPHEGLASDPQGQVSTDVLRLKLASSLWRYRLLLNSEAEHPVINRVALSFAYRTDIKDSSRKTAWGKRLDVPFLSQWNARQHPPERVCSPTSLAMIAGFYGCPLSTDEAAAQAYDKQNDIYGNWSLNMLAISRLGFRATVEHAHSLALLEDSVVAGHPVVASIAYAQGALPGAPQPASDGHLVVVAGFTKDGDVITRDPAARTENAWLEYPREAFARAWLDHGGVVYRIIPEDVA
jgi:hypothetical protein